MAILEVADASEARQFGESDPSVRSGLNRWEFYPTHVAIWRAKVKILVRATERDCKATPLRLRT